MIYRIAYKFLGSQADAEDMAQEICAALPAKLASFRGEGSFSTWLYRIVVNACRDQYKKINTARSLDKTYLELENSQALESQEAAQKSAWLHSSLTLLDPALRETALLVIGKELKHAEAAQVLGCAESTIS